MDKWKHRNKRKFCSVKRSVTPSISNIFYLFDKNGKKLHLRSIQVVKEKRNRRWNTVCNYVNLWGRSIWIQMEIPVESFPFTLSLFFCYVIFGCYLSIKQTSSLCFINWSMGPSLLIHGILWWSKDKYAIALNCYHVSNCPVEEKSNAFDWNLFKWIVDLCFWSDKILKPDKELFLARLLYAECSTIFTTKFRCSDPIFLSQHRVYVALQKFMQTGMSSEIV